MRVPGFLVLMLALGCTPLPTPESAPSKDKPGKQERGEKEKGEKQDKGEGKQEKEKPEKIQPYDKVITKDAQTRAGLFITHTVQDKTYFEIPVATLGKEM